MTRGEKRGNKFSMRFSEWVDREATRRKVKKGAVLTELAEKSGVTAQSLRSFYRGMKVGRGTTAEAVSQATSGRVTVLELMGFK